MKARAHRSLLLFGLACFAAVSCAPETTPPTAEAAPGPEALVVPTVATFSIVGYDPETGDVGVAVQSKFFAVGPVVPFAAAGVGAVATQSFANTSYGPRGLDLLSQGKHPQEAIDALTGDDEGRSRRQVGIVDAQGNAATFTGDGCLPWAGGRTGPHYAAQGNILTGPEVVDVMAAAFEATSGDLATRLVAALAAGQAAGGDARGRQSAALLVVREGGGYAGYNDRYIDLRVDDHPTPIRELRRLLDIRLGMQADQRAQADLRAARSAAGAEREALLATASEQAHRATRLYPANGWGWMTLAQVRLEEGDREAAAAAGRRGLTQDPWIKTALVQGIFGAGPWVEELLQVDSFRRVWEALPAR